MKRILILAPILVLWIAGNAQNIATDRPTQVFSPTTMTSSYFQIETGTYLSSLTESNYWAFASNLFRYGITDNIEMRMFTEIGRMNNLSTDKKTVGVSDFQLGVKWRILESEVELGYMGHVVIPGGSKDFTADNIGFINKLLVAHGIGDRIGMGYNLGIDWYPDDAVALTYAAVGSVSLTDRLSYFAEFYGSVPEFEEFVLAFDTGFYYIIKENLQVDFSFGAGITERSALYAAGISWRIPD